MMWLPVERRRCILSLKIRYSAQSRGRTTSSTRGDSVKFTFEIFSVGVPSSWNMAMVSVSRGSAAAGTNLLTFRRKLVQRDQVLYIGVPNVSGPNSSSDSTLKNWTLCFFSEVIGPKESILIVYPQSQFIMMGPFFAQNIESITKSRFSIKVKATFMSHLFQFTREKQCNTPNTVFG